MLHLSATQYCSFRDPLAEMSERMHIFSSTDRTGKKWGGGIDRSDTIRIFGYWEGVQPGHFQIDCVEHEGGHYLLKKESNSFAYSIIHQLHDY